MKQAIFFCVGVLALLSGLIGVVLPLLPTTPFVLVAAWCFARSSPRFHRMLLAHRLFGPLIRDWEQHGIIPFKVKCLSTTMMLVMVSYPLLFKSFDLSLKALVVLTVVIALSYIWSRPSVAVALESRHSRT